MRKVLFLDIDGVLTTRASRERDYYFFGESAIDAMQRLLDFGDPDLCVVHSSWRKLPTATSEDVWRVSPLDAFPMWSHDLWRSLCRSQGLEWHVPLVDAPWSRATNRGQEILLWMREFAEPDDRHVILDDETILIEKPQWPEPYDYPRWPNVLILTTDDEVGLTRDQAREAVKLWHPNTLLGS